MTMLLPANGKKQDQELPFPFSAADNLVWTQINTYSHFWHQVRLWRKRLKEMLLVFTYFIFFSWKEGKERGGKGKGREGGEGNEKDFISHYHEKIFNSSGK